MTHELINHLAQADRLLVVTDFDGTLAPLDPDPMAVQAQPTSVSALTKLAQMPHTDVVVLSGRHLEGLREVCPLRDPVQLVGSHGAEPAAGATPLSEADQGYLQEIEHKLSSLLDDQPFANVEVKPYQRVIHVARLAEVDPAAANAILDRALAIDTGGRPVTPGSNIVEFSAVKFTKGMWVERFKADYSATVFAGDDVTDESVFPVLGNADVGIKIGSGETQATLRLESVDKLADFYDSLARARGAATV